MMTVLMGGKRRGLTMAVALVLVATLLPAEPTGPVEWSQVLCLLCTRAALADALANLALYVPLGVALGLLDYAPLRGVLLAAGLSLCVETTQFAIPGRDPSLADLMFNTVGTALGIAFAQLGPGWAFPPARAAGRLSLLAGAGAAAVVTLTNVMLAVSLPDTVYFGGSSSLRSSDRPLRLGGTTEPQGYFRGRIDDVRLFNRVRTAAEIRADLNTPVSAITGSPGLVAAYNFDEGAGTVLSDASGHGNTGQIRGAAWTSQGRFGNALEFDGEESVVVIPHNPTLEFVDAMTLEAWVYPTSAQTGWRAIVQKEFDTYFLLGSSRLGPLRPAGGGTFGASTEVLGTPFVVPTLTWAHVALTYDGFVLQLYANGEPVMRRLRWYPGHITSVTIDGLALPGGPVGESRKLRERLLGGAPIRIRAVAAAPTLTLAPLATLHDAARNEVLLVAAEGNDVVVRLRTRAAAIELDNPMLRAAGLLHDVRPGDPLNLTIWRRGRRYCVDVNAHSTCDLGFSAGMGWTMFAYSQIPRGWPHAGLNIAWIGVLFFPFGYWLRWRHESLLGAIVVVLGIVVPAVVGHLSISPGEIAGAAAGTLAGWACSRMVRS